MPDDCLEAARRVGRAASERAAAVDRDGAFPADDIAALHRAGLLRAPLPSSLGGADLAVGKPELLRQVLVAVGRGSLALGRLYEGHVNAVALVVRYGDAANLGLLAREVDAGRPSGVWMAGPPLRLEHGAGGHVLRGRKILCSGAGHFRRPLVAADTPAGSVMLLPRVDDGRADATRWTAQGMRATATGDVDFDGIAIADVEIVGRPGDYLRSPYFRGGAWRVLAVQLGGLEAILDQHGAQLRDSPHRDHPLQLVRYGEALAAAETARLWVQRAGEMAEGSLKDAEAEQIDAYVDLARNAFETTALTLIARAQKAIGLKAYLRPNPLERLVRDLSTYLRQPALDISLMSAASFHLARGAAP